MLTIDNDFTRVPEHHEFDKNGQRFDVFFLYIPSPLPNLEIYELGSVGNPICPQLFVVYLLKRQLS
jgi:hypothetical protein